MQNPPSFCEIADRVATITLNRPDRLNAFNEAMHAQLAHALDRIELDRAIRAVLLTGAGRAFCAGQDLGDRRDGRWRAVDLGATLERLYNPLIRRLARLERPVVCAVNGVAAGAGANLALACDIVVAARSASFIQAFCKIGLVPDSGGTFVLPRLVGPARAHGARHARRAAAGRAGRGLGPDLALRRRRRAAWPRPARSRPIWRRQPTAASA